MNATDRIERDIRDIEHSEDITIISARDTGSHAWGLNDPTSDYDIRLIFIEDYDPNAIRTRTDSRELNAYSDDEYEYDAWSLRKFGELLNTSNPSALLFAASETRYCEEPLAFQPMCDYALEAFNPSDAIGAHRGKAKGNYWKYLLPTLRRRGEKKRREFDATEFEPTEGEGILTLQPLDDPDAPTEQIHASHIGENNWRLFHEEEERHTWRITTEYNDPAELYDKDTITATHPDTGEEIELDPAEIAPEDAAKDGDWEFRWGTNDRTIKRYIYICESLMRADIIACTQIFPPSDFDELCEEYESLDDEERYTHLPISTLREYADRKRNAEGGDYTDIPAQEQLDTALDNLMQAFQDPDNHRRGPTSEQLNEYLRKCSE